MNKTIAAAGGVFTIAIALTAQQAQSQPQQPARPPVMSHISVMNADGTGERVVASFVRILEAPNWSHDGQFLVVNGDGKLWRVPVKGGALEQIPTGEVGRINNDHGLSPDGQTIALSAGHVFTVPVGGGTPRQITQQTPSYFHGWSPDGRTLAFCGQRGGNFDLYAIGVDGGAEKRLTTSPGYDDGPDYSPDGKWIYFNSDRSGSWDIWRIPANGAGDNDALAERVTSDEREDWFPHPSPDGKRIVFLSFEKGTKGHPANKTVQLRMMKAPRRKLKKQEITVLKEFFGGQGTLNVNSWSPDSKQFAFVRYGLLP